MKFFQFLFLSLFCGVVFAQGISTKKESCYFVYLNIGAHRPTAGFSAEEMSKMQADHVGNLGDLYAKGKAYTAGPLGDNGFIRGIVVVNAGSLKEVQDCFKPDPYVQKGFMDAPAYLWNTDITKFGVPQYPFSIGLHSIAFVKKGKMWGEHQSFSDKDCMLKLLPTLSTLAASGELAIHGPLIGANETLGVLLFYSSDMPKLKSQIEQDPLIQQEIVAIEYHPQYLGIGILANPKEIAGPPRAKAAIRLFDGKSFTGWASGNMNSWCVSAGSIVGGSTVKSVPHNSFLSTTKSYRNFILRLKVKLKGSDFVNCGVQIRSLRTDKIAPRMSGYLVRIGMGQWGSIFDESRSDKALTVVSPILISRLLSPGNWQNFVIECSGSRIRVWMNGTLTSDYVEQDKTMPPSGKVVLHINGGGKGEASYKDILIEKLP